MGRQAKPIDTEKLLSMVEDQVPIGEMAKTLDVSTPTLRKRIDLLRQDQGLILEAKSVENLRVTKLKDLVLGKIERNLPHMESDDLVKTLNVLNRMDTPPEDKDGKMKGLMGMLAEIDSEAERRADIKVEERLLEEKTTDVEFTEKKLPKL